jgi:hypothetical protein
MAYADSNQFSITIAEATDPAWLAGESTNTWVEISDTDLASAQSGFTSPGGSKAFVVSYSGAAVQASGSVLWVLGGGHADYAGNEPYSITLSADAPAWTRRRDPTATVYASSEVGESHYPSDSRPTSRHTYWHLQYIAARSRLFTLGAAAVWGNGNGSYGTVDAFNPATNDYDTAGTYADMPGSFIDAGQPVAQDPATGNCYVQNGGSGALYRWNQSTATWTSIGTNSVFDDGPMVWDSTRSRLYRLTGSGTLADIDPSTASATTRTITGASSGLFTRLCYAHYVEPLDRILLVLRGTAQTVYQIDPSTWAMTEYAVAGTPPPSASGLQDGVLSYYGRFFHAPDLRLIGILRTVDDNLHVFKY